MSNKVHLTMEFDTQESLDHFVLFMDRFGEQVYWEWMESGDHPGVVRFDYWPDKNGDNYGTHHAGNRIRCPLK